MPCDEYPALRRRPLLKWLALGVAAPLLVACSAPATVLRVGSVVFPGYEFMFLARDMGLLEERRVRLIELQDNTDTLRALAAGQLEAAALSLDELTRALADGVDLRVVLVFDLADATPNTPRRLDVLAVRAQALQTHADAVRYLIAGHFAAQALQRSDPQKAATLMAARLQTTALEVPKLFRGLQLPDVIRNRQLMRDAAPLQALADHRFLPS